MSYIAKSDLIHGTFTGSWTTNTTYSGKYRFVGRGLIECIVVITLSGQPTDTIFTINPPTGFLLDTSRIPFSSGTNTQSAEVGQASFDNTGSGRYGPGIAYIASPTATAISFMTIWDLGAGNGANYMSLAIQRTTPFTWGADDVIFTKFTIPVIPV